MLFQRIKPLDQILATAEKKSLKRQLGPIQLTLLGVGAIIGTGIFVLTAQAGQKAGPGMMIAFVIAALVCALAALAYAELAAMIPVAGSAYTYTYGVLGEGLAWVVGWALILEYTIAASTVSVGWSGYVNGKVAALIAFIVITIPAVHEANFHPFLPNGWGSPMGGIGVLGAAASIFFAYVGFDAVSTASEETKNPNRNIPIGLIGSLTVCTIFYLLVGYGAVGAGGSQPMLGPDGLALQPGTPAMAAACKGLHALVCSKEPLAYVLHSLGSDKIGYLVGGAASIALPSVILMMIYGQTRIFFTMSRDGLLPNRLSTVHPRFHTPHILTMITGVFVSLFAAIFPVGLLADITNSGTLFAFMMVAVGVMILRVKQPERPRPFRTPLAWIVCPLAVVGCLLLFVNLSVTAITVFFVWAAVGLVVYYLYGYRKSHLANGTEPS